MQFPPMWGHTETCPPNRNPCANVVIGENFYVKHCFYSRFLQSSTNFRAGYPPCQLPCGSHFPHLAILAGQHLHLSFRFTWHEATPRSALGSLFMTIIFAAPQQLRVSSLPSLAGEHRRCANGWGSKKGGGDHKRHSIAKVAARADRDRFLSVA